MQLKSGLPFYLIRHGLMYDHPKLETNIKTDVLVLGGGISGALTAHYLIEAGIDCTVVDARSIGLGSTCASSSLLQYEIDVPLHRLIGMKGKAVAERAYHLCKESVHKLFQLSKKIGFEDTQLRQSLYYAAHKKDVKMLEKEFKARKEAGLDVKFLDGKELKKWVGIDAPAALLSKDGGQTNAYLLTHALHQEGIKKGMRVFDRTLATSIKHEKYGIRIKTENGFFISANKIVYATGYEASKYIDRNIGKIHSTYAIVSEVISGDKPFWKDEVLIWNTADPYLYLRATSDRRIMIGGRDENFYAPAKRDALINKKKKQLTDDLKKLFPSIEFKPEFSWAGTFGTSVDGLPFIGKHPGMPHSYFALGFGGNGIMFSHVAAELIRDAILGKKNRDMEMFGFERM